MADDEEEEDKLVLDALKSDIAAGVDNGDDSADGSLDDLGGENKDDAGDDDGGDEPAGSADPFTDDDDDYEFADLDDDDDPDDTNDIADFPTPGDDDDDFNMPGLGEFVPAGKGGGGALSGLKNKFSGGSIALIGSGSALLLFLVGLVTWLSLSFDEEAHNAGAGKVEVVTSLAGLAPPDKAKSKTAAKPSKKTAPKLKAEAETKLAPAPADKKPEKPAADEGGIMPSAKKSEEKKPDAKKDPVPAAAKDGKGDSKKDGTTEEAAPGTVLMAKVDSAMIVETPSGPMPVITPDGRQAWQVYARPFELKAEDKKAGKIALVIAGLGLSKTQTLAAIQELPGEATLSFAPYARNLGDWIAQARAAGHEVILEVPMEPKNYPDSDPGPHTLLTSKGPDDNIKNLNWLLSRFPGYVGVTNFLGEKFTKNEEAMQPVLQYLKKRGLMYLDSRASRKSVGARLAKEIKMPRAYNTRFIDKEASRVAIDARLLELERIGKSTGAAVGIGFAFPVTLERLKAWIANMREKKIVLVPLSAVANLQNIR